MSFVCRCGRQNIINLAQHNKQFNLQNLLPSSAEETSAIDMIMLMFAAAYSAVIAYNFETE
jgi:hypothetical protein